MIAINSTLKRKTLKSILESEEFCLGFPGAEHASEVDYLGIASGYDKDKIKDIDFTVKKAESVNTPIITEFKVTLECKVMNIDPVGSHTQITDEIMNIQADEDILDDKNRIPWLMII